MMDKREEGERERERERETLVIYAIRWEKDWPHDQDV